MSEIKITEDSLENAILRDGQFVSGYVIDSGSINASGYGAHAEGYAKNEIIDASGNGAHAEGINTQALADGAHAEGLGTQALNEAEHAEGKYNKSNTNTISSIGIGTSGNRKNAIEVLTDGSVYVYGVGGYDGTNPANAIRLQDSLGGGSYVLPIASENTLGGIKVGDNLAIDNNGVISAIGYIYDDIKKSFAEGYNTNANGQYSHAEGQGTLAYGDGAHAEGYVFQNGIIKAEGKGAFAGGYVENNSSINAIGNGAFAGGSTTIGSINAIGTGSFAYGRTDGNSSINAIGNGAHAEGCNTQATNNQAHAEGYMTYANGISSHTEGNSTYANGNSAHAEGKDTSALGDYSHTAGLGTIAHIDSSAQTVVGRYNNPDKDALFIVGNGDDDEHRSNAFVVYRNGQVSYNNEESWIKIIVGGQKSLVHPDDNEFFKYIDSYGNSSIMTTPIIPEARNFSDNIMDASLYCIDGGKDSSITLHKYYKYVELYRGINWVINSGDIEIRFTFDEQPPIYSRISILNNLAQNPSDVQTYTPSEVQVFSIFEKSISQSQSNNRADIDFGSFMTFVKSSLNNIFYFSETDRD